MFSDAPHVFRRGCSPWHAEIWTQRFCSREAGVCSSAAPGEGAADGAPRTLRTPGAAAPPAAGELGSPRPPPPALGARATAASPNSYFCLLFVSFRGPAAGGTWAGAPGPGRDSAPRTRAGGGEPAPRLGGAGLRSRASPRAGRVEPASSPPVARSLYRSKVSVPGRAHAAQGGERRRPRAGARGAELGSRPQARAATGPGRGSPRSRRSRRRRATPAAPRAGRGQLFPSDSTRSVGLTRPSAPPFRALPCLHHPQAKYCYFTAPNLVPFEYIIYFLWLKGMKSEWFCAKKFLKKSVSHHTVLVHCDLTINHLHEICMLHIKCLFTTPFKNLLPLLAFI